ncbi:serine/threonine-protein kinase [Nocardia callitridis]|uniref:non-specific serine/threonine protein kinase n=1 Tax=Nocardia callitridis TaxID=648753 RepID=A0ABP9L1T1_9NOCA
MGEVRSGGYLLERLLGKGGMGQVWLAHDVEAAHWVALKLLPTELAADARYRKRFEREAEVVSRLRNPHIPGVHRFGELDGRLFIDMEYIEGEDLASTLAAHGPMPPAVAVGILGQVAEALDTAHRAGLVHRDVKPSNIVVNPSGFTFLIDFGIAHGFGRSTSTTTGLAIGTMAYMAPERFAGTADARSDVYSLACVLYECLTGARPYGDTDPAQQMHAHLMTAPPRARAVNPKVPGGLDAVIARGMAKNPEERYSTAADFTASARDAAGVEIVAPPARPIATVRARAVAPKPTKLLPEPGPKPTLVATRLAEPPVRMSPGPAVPQGHRPSVAVPPSGWAGGSAPVPYPPPPRPPIRGRSVFPGKAAAKQRYCAASRARKRSRTGRLIRWVLVLCLVPLLLIGGCAAVVVATGGTVGVPADLPKPPAIPNNPISRIPGL